MCFVHGGGEHRPELQVPVGLGRSTSEAQVIGEGEQALLRTVVEIPLEAPALVVTRLDDARLRGAKLFELVKRLGLQSLVLESEPNCGSDMARQLGNRGAVRDDGKHAFVRCEAG